MSPRIIFFGTPKFSVPALEKLVSDFDVVAVVTKEDSPHKRDKKTLVPTPVKTASIEHDIPVMQPNKITDETIEKIKSFNPDLFVIVAYGKILPTQLLDIPKYGSVNIHPSLLPLYRGPSPIQAQILDGVKNSGVSIMLIDDEMDHGPILKSIPIELSMTETYESLGEKLFEIGAENLPSTISGYISGKITPSEQNHENATFCKIIKKEDGLIDWKKPAQYIERMTRAYNPWPGAHTFYKDMPVKIIRATALEESENCEPGTFFFRENKLYASCNEGSKIEIHVIQPAGKKPMPGTDFARGYLRNGER